MAEHVTVFNPTDQPVVIDTEGHTLGGGEWAAVDREDPTISAELAAGRLVVVETPDSSGPEGLRDERAEAAFAATRDARTSGGGQGRRKPKQEGEE